MSKYPPRLLRLSETNFGSLLFLDDSTHVSIDVRPARLSEVMVEYGRPPLAELLGRIGVYVGQCQMSAAQWEHISDCIRSSTEAVSMFSRFSSLWTTFNEPYSGLAQKVHRLYGGLDQSLYTCHPCDFREDPNRPLPWYYALLSARDGWLFKTWVNLNSRKVEIEAGQYPGHYVE